MHRTGLWLEGVERLSVTPISLQNSKPHSMHKVKYHRITSICSEYCRIQCIWAAVRGLRSVHLGQPVHYPPSHKMVLASVHL